jgi:uncharacterized protein (TIGR03437 family)
VLAFVLAAPLAKSACTFSSVSASGSGYTGSAFYVKGTGTTGNITINVSGAGCTWSASSSFTTLTPSSGTSTGTTVLIGLSIGAYSGGGQRDDTITITVNSSSVGSFPVYQNSTTCSISSLSPSSANIPAAGGSGSFTINDNNCWFNYSPSGATWVNYSFTSLYTVSYTVSANTGAARTDTFSFSYPSSTAFTLNQAAAPATPTLSSISPSSGVQGTSVPVTLTGSNFIAGASVSPGNAGITVSGVTVVSSTQITATFAISASASLGAGNVTVTTSAGTTTGVSFTVTAPPTLTSITPNSGTAGTSVSVTLTGTNFVTGGGTLVKVSSGAAVSSVNVISATQLTATFAISGAASGSANVSVTTSGGTSGTVPFSYSPPVPTLTSVSPNSGARGTGVTVTLAGTNFIAGATVSSGNAGVGVSGVNVVSSTQINAIFTISAGASLGAGNVTVTTSGGTTGAVSFTVTGGAPTLTSISPTSGVAGTSIPVILTGTNFISGATVNVSIAGVSVSGVTVVSATQIDATFTSSACASLGGNVTVTTSGGTTGPVSFAFTSAAPTLTSISPNSGVAGTSVLVTLTGTNVCGAPANPNYAGITVINQVFVSATQITATFVIAPGAIAGTANVTVTTPGGTSNSVSFMITAVVPTLSSINPSSGVQGANVQVILTGNNFVSGASVNPNYSGITVSSPNVVSATQITATFVIASNSTPGIAYVTVTTSAGTTASVTFNVMPGPPTLTSISPNNGAAGASVPVTLSGSNFVSGATTVNVGGGITVNNPTVISTSQLNATFVIPAGALGSVNVSVTTAAGTSANIPFTVTAPQPTVTSVVPSSTTAGGPSFNLTVNGSGFVSGATVNWGSQALSTTFVGSGLLTASVPASLIVTPGGIGITVTSGNITTGAVQFTINPSTVTTLKLNCSPSAGPTTQGVSYLATCTVSGGTAPYAWSIGSGALPQGLTSSGTTGTSINISGTPASAGSYSYSVKVTDSSATAQTQSQSYSGTIAAPPPTTVSLNCTGANGPSTVGVRYADTCTAPNGTAPFAWSISAGALPAGVNLNGSPTGTATISGTPTAAGPYSYTLTVSDSTGPTPLSGSQVFSGTIGAAGSPTLTVSPASLSFTYRPDTGLPVQQSLSLFTTGTATSFTVGVNGSWLTASPSGGQTPGNISVSVVNITGLAPGTYNGHVTVTALNVNPPSVTVPVSLVVQAVPQPQLTLGQTHFAYGLTQGSSAVQAQLLVTNPGGGVLSFTTQVTGCSCVSVSTAAGQASAGTPAAVGFTVNPAGLPPSTYNSAIVISASDGETVTVPVQTAVNSLSQSIVLTQTGLLFGTVAQGGAPPAQSFNVINAGQGTMNYSLSVQTLSGTPGWVSVGPSSGSVAANAVSAPVVVTVNPAGLAIGQYYATVQVIAANAGNSPQVVSVLLNVVDPSQGAVLVSPTGVLVGSAAGTNLTGALTLYNLSNQALSYTSTVSTTDGGSWLLVSPSSGTVPAEGSTQVTVSGNAAALPTGTGQGVVRVGFSNGIVQSVGVSSLSIAASASAAGADAQTSCKVTNLVPTVTASIGPSFTVTQGQPVSLSVSVVDNCNNIVPSGTVTAQFTDGDPTITLFPKGSGAWTGTWTPNSARAQVTVTILITENTQVINTLGGFTQLTGTVQPAGSTEAPAPASALNSANASPATQISPGSWVTIFGDRMANGTQSASGTFPPSLVGTAVMIGSTALPLDYVGPTQVNALLPFSLTPNSTVSLAVQRSGTVSVPIAVTIADLGPAIFSMTGDGTGQGAVVVASSGVLAAPVGAFPGSQPVARGDFLAIYCTGLGAVNNTPADGAPAPSSPPFATTLATPNVTIGGMPAAVSYSGLAPGLVGLYQVNVQVPNNAPTGDAVNLAITVGSLTSNTVTVAVQ